ncbi:MAG TPA: Na+/H+ antiporter subunit C [Aliiroseovarius sp.]|nr:Na+/H+ antiporter subunit C [Aliiroseovarius sp.]
MQPEFVTFLVGHANYWLFVFLMMTGFYIVVAKGNLVKKVIGLNMFQSAVIMLYISMGKVAGGTAPIFPIDGRIDPATIYTNPLPHVLMLTAIVVGIATTALALALIIRIREAYDTIEEADIQEAESTMAIREQRLYGAAMGDPEA